MRINNLNRIFTFPVNHRWFIGGYFIHGGEDSITQI